MVCITGQLARSDGESKLIEEMIKLQPEGRIKMEELVRILGFIAIERKRRMNCLFQILEKFQSLIRRFLALFWGVYLWALLFAFTDYLILSRLTNFEILHRLFVTDAKDHFFFEMHVFHITFGSVAGYMIDREYRYSRSFVKRYANLFILSLLMVFIIKAIHLKLLLLPYSSTNKQIGLVVKGNLIS